MWLIAASDITLISGDLQGIGFLLGAISGIIGNSIIGAV